MLFLLGTSQRVLTIIRLHLMSHNEDAKKYNWKFNIGTWYFSKGRVVIIGLKTNWNLMLGFYTFQMEELD